MTRLRVSQPACGTERIERIIRHDISEIQQADNGSNESPSGKDANKETVTGSEGEKVGRFEPAVILTTDGMLAWLDEAGLLNQVPYQDFCIDMYAHIIHVKMSHSK